MNRFFSAAVVALFANGVSLLAPAAEVAAIRFNTNFEGASLGKVDVIGDAEFRCHVEGQQNEEGRNRQATWYYFRIDGARGREIRLTLTGFVGEYNHRPAVAMSTTLRPVWSADGENWTHFPEAEWNEASKEMTVKLKVESDAIYIAHVPPYTHARLLRLIEELNRRECVLVEVIGRTALGRELHAITVTSENPANGPKRCVWLQARQHAWEAGTSWVMEGALRYLTSDEPAARAWRERIVFRFAPMLDPDGCALGKVRFNANGYDLNRHWNKMDLRSKAALERMPEIWYAKKAIFQAHAAGPPIDLLLNMHNTETGEYLSTLIAEPPASDRVARLFRGLKERSSFDPSRVPMMGDGVPGTANDLWTEARIPAVLMEQRIGPSAKLGRSPTIDDRLQFGRALIDELANAVLADAPR